MTEFLILETLSARPGIVKSRNQLMDIAYQDDVYVDDRTIDSHIKRIRRKFRAVDPEFDAIETQIREIVQAQLATNNWGVGIEYLGIKRLGLPESVTQAVFDRMTSERKVLADTHESKGLSEAAKIRSTAEREAAEKISKADSEAISDGNPRRMFSRMK